MQNDDCGWVLSIDWSDSDGPPYSKTSYFIDRNYFKIINLKLKKSVNPRRKGQVIPHCLTIAGEFGLCERGHASLRWYSCEGQESTQQGASSKLYHWILWVLLASCWCWRFIMIFMMEVTWSKESKKIGWLLDYTVFWAIPLHRNFGVGWTTKRSKKNAENNKRCTCNK